MKNDSSNKENENFSNSDPKLVEIESFSNHLSSNNSKDKKSDNENNNNNSHSNSNEKQNDEIEKNIENNKNNFNEEEQNYEIKKLKNQKTINYELTDSITMENKNLNSLKNNENKLKLENDDRESVHEFYLKKLNYLSNLFNFSQKYISIILSLFKKFVEPFYSKISFIYVNNIRPNLKYFKDSTIILQNFINSYKNVNNQIQNNYVNNNETETKTSKMIKKVSNIYYDYINNLSKEIKNQTNDLKINLKNFENLNGIYEENFKKMLNNISKIEHRKLKCESLYKKNYEKIFENFKNNYKKENFDDILINMDDFLIIEYNLVKYINKLFLKISIFINDIKNLILNSKENLFNLLNLLEICFKIFYNENNLILKESILNEFGNLNDLIDEFTKEKIDKELSIFNIIQKKNSNENKINEFNKNLLELKKILNENKFVDNEKIKIEKLFNIENYKNIENFLDFLLEFVPNQIKIKFNEHFYYNSKFKRNPGIFKSWKNCFLVITYQGHVIIFDEDKNIENNISNKNNVDIDLDNDKLIFFIYNINKIEIKIKSSKKNKYILSVCEIGINKKRVKNIILDAITIENLENVMKKINNSYEEEEYF